MAMYKQINDDTLILSQQAIYGSSRLGVLEREEVVSIDSTIHTQTPTIPDPLTEHVTHWTRGHKRYELTNHLGNVLATVSDRKLPVYQNGSFHHYKAEVMTANDYYAFGMAEPKRGFDTSDYRFGFGSHEKDDEIYKANEWYAFGDYGYDPRIVQRPRTEPLASKYPQLSPYVVFGDNPILYRDPDGKEIHLSFESEAAKKAYLNTVNKSLGGFYTASVVPVLDNHNYVNKVVLTPTGQLGPMTESQQSFSEEYGNAVASPIVSRQEVVQNDKATMVGSYISNKIDIADIEEFDKAGKGGTSSAGALIHETVEQQEKSKQGLAPNEGSLATFKEPHNKATEAENKVDGNKRFEIGGGSDTFLEKDGSVTLQDLKPNQNGGIDVKKSTTGK